MSSMAEEKCSRVEGEKVLGCPWNSACYIEMCTSGVLSWLQILGLKELRQLLKWREKMRKFLEEAGESDDGEEHKEGVANKTESEEDKLAKVDEKVKQLKEEEQAEVKRCVWRKFNLLFPHPSRKFVIEFNFSKIDEETAQKEEEV